MSHIPIIYVIVLILTLISFLVAFRVKGRFKRRRLREADLGEMIWYHLEYQVENARASTSSSQSMSQACYGLIKKLEASDGNEQRYDGAVSVIWHRGDDNLVRLYIGITKNSSGGPNISNIGNFATNMGFRAREITEEEFPQFDASSAAVAEYSSSRVVGDSLGMEPTQGVVARTLADNDNLHGTVIMTFEPMGGFEAANFSGRFNDDAKTASSEAGSNHFFQRAVAKFSHSPVRASIAAVSHDGSTRNSAEIVSLIVTSLSSTFFNARSAKPLRGSSASSVFIGAILSLIPVLPLSIYWVFAQDPNDAMVITALILCASPLAVAIAVTKSSALNGTNEFYDWLNRGEVVIPRFNVVNPAQLLRRWVLRSGQSDERRQSTLLRWIIPRPGDPATLPLNGDSMFEMISVSGKNPGKNLALPAIPMVGLPANYENRANNDLFVGFDGDEGVVTYKVSDIPYGLFTLGMPTSGKSNTLETLFISMTNECVKKHHSNLLTPIWGETKGEGAYDVWDSVKHVDRALFIDFHNPGSPFRLSLEGRRITNPRVSVEDVIVNCEAFVSAMQYAWGEGIKAESRASLIEMIRIPMLATADDLEFFDFPFQVDTENPNIIPISLYLAGGFRGDSQEYREKHGMRDRESVLSHQLSSLFEELTAILEEHRDSKGNPDNGYIDDKKELQRIVELRTSVSRMLTYHEGRGSDLLSPPRNKLAELNRASHFWEPGRRKDIYLHQLPKHDAPIVMNTGPYRLPEGGFSQSIDGPVSQKLLRMTIYILWKHIEANCQGWQRDRKYVPLFFDELSDVASSSFSEETPNVVDDITNTGRSMGCGLFAGTQTYGRLNPMVINDVIGFPSQVYHRTRNPEDSKAVVSSIGTDSVFTPEHIKNSPNGTGMASLKYGNSNTPVFTLQSPKAEYWARCLFEEDPVTGGVSIEEAITRYEQEFKHKGRSEAHEATRKAVDA